MRLKLRKYFLVDVGCLTLLRRNLESVFFPEGTSPGLCTANKAPQNAEHLQEVCLK